MTGRTHAKGLLLTVSGVLVFTPDTLLIRLTAIDDFHMAVGRGALGGLVMLLGCALWYRGSFPARVLGMGGRGLAVALMAGLGGIAFYAALERTSVANVLIIFATTPLIGAILGRVFLGERVGPSTVLAIVGAGIGLAIVAGSDVESGRWAGDLIALVNTSLVAGTYTVIRRHREVNMIPAAGLGLIVGAIIALPFAQIVPMTDSQWLWMVLGGCVVLPGGFTLVTLGPRYLPVPEVAMLMLLETVLGPIWVWLVIGETPGPRTLVGGAIVLGTLFAHSAWRLWRARSPSPNVLP